MQSILVIVHYNYPLKKYNRQRIHTIWMKIHDVRESKVHKNTTICTELNKYSIQGFLFYTFF